MLHLALLLIAAASLAAAPPKKAKSKSKSAAKTAPIPITILKRTKPVDFQTEILPVLRRNCVACHSSSKSEDNLVLETPQTILKGGDDGPAVVPKKSGESLLLIAAAHLDDPTMPPADNKVQAKPLTPDQLGLIKLWIDQGAKGTVSITSAPLKWQKLRAERRPDLGRRHRARRPVRRLRRANRILIYHLASGAEVARLVDPALAARFGGKNPGAAHLDLVQSLAFDPTGDLLASGGYREVKLWRRPHDVKLADLTGSGAAIRSQATSADGKLAATGDV